MKDWNLTSGQCLGVHSGSVASIRWVLNGAGKVVCAGTETGVVLFLELYRVPSGPTVLTAVNHQQARCPLCGQKLAPPPVVVAAFRNPHSEFLSPCPHCQQPLHFNPFFADANDFAEVLRRGLEQSRREKGNDHEETLTHLAALAVEERKKAEG